MVFGIHLSRVSFLDSRHRSLVGVAGTKEGFLIRSAFGLIAVLIVLQLAPGRLEAAAGFRVAGEPMSCKDFRGRSVVAVKVSDLGDVGRAWVVNTVPYILLDPEVMRTLPKPLQIFFYAHECAHHTLGHWYNPSPTSEREADCWAIKFGRSRGIFRRQTVVDFAPWMVKTTGSRFGHLPGPLRMKYLLACFDNDLETAQQ